jgi:aspartate aminotransferase-like enzyme
MFQVGGYLFKRAETRHEFEQIHRLNYETFVAEIPQHADPGDGRLVDKFHTKNCYYIAFTEGRVIGMVSTHDQPPFSVADRLSDPSILGRPGTRPLEVRLLAIEPARRNTTVVLGLMMSVYEHAQASGYTHLYISAVESRLAMYEEMGFEPLGPAVRGGEARFVPMAVDLGRLTAKKKRTIELWRHRLEREAVPHGEPVCLLPGPVRIASAVHQAFHEGPIYHRGPEFIALFERVRRVLADLVGCRDVALLNGSGTLANEVVGATLAADPAEQELRSSARGVLLVNGEFGQRLAKQASRFGLRPRVLTWDWGQPWDLDEVEAALACEPPGSWVWGVHQESSTGVLNDLPGLVGLAKARGIRVCVDCISSLGAVPLDLTEVYLATGTSGKSLGSYAGAALVFADARSVSRIDTSRVPSYLDLPATLIAVGPRYTFPSPTLRALEAALSEYADPELARARYAHYVEIGAYVRQQLRRLGLEPLADEGCASPVVTTFTPAGEVSAEEFVTRCRQWGFAIGGQSGYLTERCLVQIATMGAVTRQDVAPLFAHLARWLGQATSVRARREELPAPALITG